MIAPASALETAERRVRKFLNRAEKALTEPLFADRRGLYEMKLVWQIEKATGEQTVRLEQPEFSVTEINSAIVACRVFFLSTEDAYLPSVVQALSQLSDQGHARLLRSNGLSKFIGQFVKDGRLVGGNFMASGRLEEDNGAGEKGQLLGSGQMAMDYIYGVAVHEEDERLARLANVSGPNTMLYATAMELGHLMFAVATLREQIRMSATNGHLSIEVEVGDATEWSKPLRPGEEADE